MELTGKAKESFGEWFQVVYCQESYNLWNIFNSLPCSFKWGVYVDFFDSVGYCIEICKMHISEYYYWMVNDGDEENKYKTRAEARKASIEKACELYNEKHFTFPHDLDTLKQ